MSWFAYLITFFRIGFHYLRKLPTNCTINHILTWAVSILSFTLSVNGHKNTNHGGAQVFSKKPGSILLTFGGTQNWRRLCWHRKILWQKVRKIAKLFDSFISDNFFKCWDIYIANYPKFMETLSESLLNLSSTMLQIKRFILVGMQKSLERWMFQFWHSPKNFDI